MVKPAERCNFRAGDKIDGRYKVEKLLGEGAFGKVFKVIDSETQNVYALKLLKLWEVAPEIREQLVARFDMEFETGRINSKYLVHSVSHGFSGGNPYIVMEFCPHGDLMYYLESTPSDLAKIGREVLYGLKDLHRCGKVHRDLKPENVLIREDGVAVLTDFGIAGDRNKRLTERNWLGNPTQIFGTYAYMPPEQVHPQKDATVLPTTDIFSFGVMMYQLITKELPFGRLNDENDLVIYINNGREGRWNRECLERHKKGSTFSPVISRCLHPDFKKRLQTVDNVLSYMPDGKYDAYKPSDVGFRQQVINGLLLRVMQGEEYGRIYKLNELIGSGGRIVTVGWKGNMDNTLPVAEDLSRYISRRHSTLEYDAANRQWHIRDGQWHKSEQSGWKRSLNGTYVNSTEVSHDGMKIHPGDIISIGDVKFRVEGY